MSFWTTTTTRLQEPPPSGKAGVELETFLIDLQTLAPGNYFRNLQASVPARVRSLLHDEFLDCHAEIVTNPQASISEIHRELSQTWRTLSQAARGRGVGLLLSGVHPFWKFDANFILPSERSSYTQSRCAGRLQQFATASVHFHAEAKPSEVVPLMNALAGVAPLLTSLTANSPLLHGTPTGVRSKRVEWWGRLLPTSGFPPRFADLSDLEAYIEQLRASSLVRHAKDIYWPVRPSRHGTVELRTADAPLHIDHIPPLAALIQCLAVATTESYPLRTRWDLRNQHPELCTANSLKAAVHGPEARFTIPGLGPVPVREIVDGLVSALKPIARDLDCAEYVEGVRSLPDENGSSFQLREFEKSGSALAVTRALLDECDRRQ